MAEAVQFMDFLDLVHYNDLLNERNKNRLKYKGVMDFSKTGFSISSFPYAVGNVFVLSNATDTSVKQFEYDGVYYNPGDTIMMTGKTGSHVGITALGSASSQSPFMIVKNSLPSVDDIRQETLVLLLQDEMTGSDVTHRRGFWLFNATAKQYTLVNQEDFLDVDSFFSGTSAYEGATNKLVDSYNLNKQIKNLSRYIDYSMHPKVAFVNTKAELNAVDMDSLDVGQYFYFVRKDQVTVGGVQTIVSNLYVCNAVQKKDGKPERQMVLVGDVSQIINNNLRFVDKLPVAGDADYPVKETMYWLNAQYTAGTDTYSAGMYIYKPDSDSFFRPYESTQLDFAPTFKGTKKLPDTDPSHEDPTYSGSKSLFVESKYLYETLDGVVDTIQQQINDITQISKAVHYSIVNNKAALDAIDLTALDANSLNIYLVTDDDTVDHVQDGKTYFKYAAQQSVYNYAYIDDATLTPQKSDVDFDSTVYACVCYDDDKYPVVTRQMKLIGKLKYKLRYDEKPIDLNKIATGTAGANAGYEGSPIKASSTSYLKQTMEDAFRWITPLHSVTYVTVATKADLDAVDLTALDSNKTYIYTVTQDETYPRGTTPQTYDRTQYMAVAVEYDGTQAPARQMKFIGKIDDVVIHPFQIVDELPDVNDAAKVPVLDTAYWLMADVMDGTIVKNHAGLYLFDKSSTTLQFVRPYEDKNLDTDYMFDGTLTKEYEGDKDKFVDSSYLYDQLTDIARYIKPFHHLTPVDVDTYAGIGTYLATADHSKAYLFTVDKDEENTVSATADHAAYNPTWQYFVVAVQKKAREDGTTLVPQWNYISLGEVTKHEHPVQIVHALPDITDVNNKPNRNMLYWLDKDVMNPDGTTVDYHAGLYCYNLADNEIVHPYQDKNLDTDYIFDGTLTKEYGGDLDKFVDSFYMYEQFKDFARYVKPFHHVQPKQFDTNAAMTAWIPTADNSKMYIVTVKQDQTHTVAATATHAEYNPAWQYIVVATQQATREDGTTTVPAWTAMQIGQVTPHEHPFAIVDALPDLAKPEEKPNRDMIYWLKADVMNPDGVTVDFHAGLYRYDFTGNTITHPYEDTDLDFEPSYKGTKYLPDTDPKHEDPTYSGDEDKFIDSKYLYKTLDGVIETLQEEIDDITEVSKNVHYQVVDDIAALNAIDLTALDANSLNIFLVADDDTVDHVEDGKTYFKYVADFSEYNYAYLGDPTLTPQKSDVDFDSTIYACACYDDVKYPVIQRQMKFIGKLKYKLHIDDEALDINKLVTGTDSVNKGYEGSESKIVSTKYLHDTLQDYLRWISPLHHVTYATYDTKADLDAVDLATLDADKTYVITVKADETYPRNTIPQTYDRTQYAVVTVDYDTDSKPVRALHFMGKIDDQPIHPYQIVEQLPKAQEILNSTTYLLTQDQSDDDGNLAYTAGTYHFDKATQAFTDLDAKHMRLLGQLELNADTRADWDDLVPCHAGDMWILTSDDETDIVKIGDVEYKPGEFVVVTTTKLTGTGVQVERIASGSDAILIVDKLPDDGIKDTVFYAIPNSQGYEYKQIKWYTAKSGTDYTIQNDGIHDATSLVLPVKDITSATDIATYCDQATAADAQDALKYLVTYKKSYEDGTSDIEWNTHANAPYAPTDTGWTYAVPAKKFSVYVYDTQNAEWDCIYPIEAEAIYYVSDITNVPSPKTTVLYGIHGQTDIHYYSMPQTQIDAGSTVDSTGVHLLGAGVELSYADIAQNPTVLSMTYGFTEATELTADINTVVTYVDDGETHACNFPSYNKREDTQVYIYNGATFEKIYPQDSVENVLVHVQLTREQYAKVVDGTSVLYTYDDNTVYDITDPEREAAPKAYLRNVNILSNNAIIDVTALPSGTEDVAKVDRDSFYRLKNNVLRYSSIAYYDLSAQYYITQTTGDNPHDVVAHLDSGAQVIDISVDQLRADEQAWATNVTTYGIVATTKAAATANSIVCYKDKEAADPSKYISASAASFDDAQTVTQIELYFYSDERNEWVCVYPSTVQFEDEDIDFYDADVWHPIKP